MNEIIKHSTSLPDVTALKVADNFSITEEGGRVLINRFPTPTEYQLLKQRENDLRRALRPITYASEDQRRAAQALAVMFAGYPAMRNVNAKDNIAAYALHLKDLPLFAILETCEAVTKNKVKHFATDLPPPANILYADAEARANKLNAELVRYSRILNAKQLEQPVVSESERERINRAIEEWRATSAKAFDPYAEEREQRIERTKQYIADRNTQQILDDYAQRGEEPQRAGDLVVSAELRDMLKNRPTRLP